MQIDHTSVNFCANGNYCTKREQLMIMTVIRAGFTTGRACRQCRSRLSFTFTTPQTEQILLGSVSTTSQ